MTEWVRVKDKSTKHEYTVARESVDPEAHEVLKKDAVDSAGAALPGKPYRSSIDPTETASTRAEERDRERSAS